MTDKRRWPVTFAAATIAPVVSRLAAGQAWLSRLAARREIAADAFALAAGASRAAIASAQLKVGPAGLRTHQRSPLPSMRVCRRCSVTSPRPVIRHGSAPL